MLTRKQQELLTFINNQISETGVSPSFDEMKDALDLRSKSGVHRLVMGLEERGFIRRLAHKARALEVTRLPEDAALTASRAPRREPARRDKPLHAIAAKENTGSVSLPLHGLIAAGTPIEALNDPNAFVDVPREMLGRGNHYALEVSGRSMIDDGIMDGDVVIIEEGVVADNGAIVVALVRQEEATLKHIDREPGRVILRAANPDFPPQEYAPDEVEVQGRLISLIRRYH
jgi:repressor LexA